nr:DUF4328 domain-containing protein [Streptomyces sp. SID7805]
MTVHPSGRCEGCERASGLPRDIAVPVAAPAARPHPAVRTASPWGPAAAVLALLGISAAAAVFSFVVHFQLYGLLDLISGDGPDDVALDAAERADNLQSLAEWCQLATLLPTAIAFVVWLRRVRLNAEVFVPDGHRRARGWVIGGWLVPGINFWFPKQIADDIWRASRPYAPDGTPQRASLAPVTLWWAAWLADFAVGCVYSGLIVKAEEPDEFRTVIDALIVDDALTVVVAGLAALFVALLSRMQTAKLRQGPLPTLVVSLE